MPSALPCIDMCAILRILRLDLHAHRALVPLLFVALVAPHHARGDTPADAGEAIYRFGVLNSGQPLETFRAGGVQMKGADVACVKCHRRSGFGSKEGFISIPPIAGRYLFQRTSNHNDFDLPFVENMRRDRAPYNDETLARAIREGVDSGGKPLNYLMPHFALGDANMTELIAYLKRLGQRRSPGVTDTVLHFATIITPDADPVKARGMLDVLKRYFEDRNTVQFAPTPRLHTSSKLSWASGMFMVNRRWQLHVWQLTGPAATWQEQLERHFAEEPVLAVVSGLAGKTWGPVHAFCERQAVPCLFPNVEAPPAGADHDFYSLYFSRGVELEAGLIATRILKPDHDKVAKEVLQIYRADDSGDVGAHALAALLERHGIKTRSYVLAADAPGKGVAKIVRHGTSADALVLWLRPADIAALGQAPFAPSDVFVSGLMGGLENSPLPPIWRTRAELTYPFDLPDKRRVPVDYALGWFRIRRIPIVAEQVQADTYLACGLLSETLKHMVDTFVPDYLVERLEDMIDRRIITGYYPHLTLAQNQRFASKGGYIVHFAEPQGTRVIADNGWTVP